MLANYQTDFGYKLTCWRMAGTHDPIQRVELWTHPNSIHSSVADQSSRIQWITENVIRPAKAWLSVSKTSRSRFHWVVFSVRFVAKRYILQQKCLNRQIGTCLLETLWYNFYPCTPTLREPRCTDLHTVKRTDGRHDNANNRSKRCDYTV